jgi:hypothetical protein
MNRMRMVLFDMANRMFGPYLATIHRILISAMGKQLQLCCMDRWGADRYVDTRQSPACKAQEAMLLLYRMTNKLQEGEPHIVRQPEATRAG